MLIGIVCEGGLDDKPLRTLIQRTISDNVRQPSLNPIEFKKPYCAEGEIITKIDAGVETLSIGTAPDLIVLYSDIDKFPNRRNALIDWIRENGDLQKITFFVVEPHFEHIFFVEKNSMVRTLSLDATKPVPHENLASNPKERLQMIVGNKRKDGTIKASVSKEEIYVDITKGLNLDILCRNCPDYNNFRQELINICNNI